MSSIINLLPIVRLLIGVTLARIQLLFEASIMLLLIVTRYLTRRWGPGRPGGS